MGSSDDDDKEESGGLIFDRRPLETLFNALQFEATVIDIRSEDEFKASHVERAVNVPTVEAAAQMKALKWPRVMVYDDGTESESNALKHSKLFEMVSTLGAVQFCVVEGGYDQFQNRYPFLCVSGRERVEYPNICPTTNGRIFVGGLAHAESAAVIQDLGITHIVNTKGTASKLPEDVAKGIKYHSVKIEDEEKQSVMEFFAASSEFVERALAEHADHRVLIHCGGGKSRSTTFTMAYLVSTRKQSLAFAYGQVSLGRPKAYPNDGFVSELEKLEVKVHGTSSKPFIAGSRLRNKGRWKQVLASWGIQ